MEAKNSPLLLVLLEAFEQEFHGRDLVHGGQQAAQDPDFLHFVRLHQQLLAAGAGAVDVDGREDAPLGDLALEVDFHVAGALELLVDHIVHARAGLDQRGGDDGQAAAFLDVAGGAEEFLRLVQRVGIDAAGQHLARGRDDGVVGARQAGDGIEQDHHVALVLDQALGLLDHHVGHLHVARGGFVEGAGDDLAAHRAAHFGDFLRALVDQQHHEVNLGVVDRQRVGNRLQHHGLAGLGRRHDQAALAFADRRHHVDDARGDVLGGAIAALEREALVGEQWREVLEQNLVAGRFQRLEVQLVDLEQREVALAVLGRANLAGDGVAGAQAEAADLTRRDVDVIQAGQVGIGVRAQEAVAVRQHFHHAFAEDVLALAGVGLEQGEDDFFLALAGGTLQTRFLGHGHQFGHRR